MSTVKDIMTKVIRDQPRRTVILTRYSGSLLLLKWSTAAWRIQSPGEPVSHEKRVADAVMANNKLDRLSFCHVQRYLLSAAFPDRNDFFIFRDVRKYRRIFG